MAVPTAFLILADEAASQRVAGLTLLDRLVLALNEHAEQSFPDEIIQVAIFWNPEIPVSAQGRPGQQRIPRINLAEATTFALPSARVLHTRLFVGRDGLTEFLNTVFPVSISQASEPTASDWSDLSTRFIDSLSSSTASESWLFVRDSSDIARCERVVLRSSGKSQDGIVSRFINRPFSRRLSRILLRYDLTPTAWTFYAFALPVLAFICLARGDYFGIVAGTFFFQIYSMIDGCDGEMARATYRESERGGRIDDFLDMLGSLLFVIGLGLGLFRSRSFLIYLLEGILCAAVILVNEWSLRRLTINVQPESQKLAESLYPRHQRLFANVNAVGASQDFFWWIIQFTKRDVAILVFLVLALLGQAQWILHLWLAVSAGTLLLSARSSRGQARTRDAGT